MKAAVPGGTHAPLEIEDALVRGTALSGDLLREDGREALVLGLLSARFADSVAYARLRLIRSARPAPAAFASATRSRPRLETSLVAPGIRAPRWSHPIMRCNDPWPFSIGFHVPS